MKKIYAFKQLILKKIKIIFLVVLIAVSGLNAQSQVLISLLFGEVLNSGKVEFGLEGGGNFSSILGMDTKKYVQDWNLGFYFDIKMKKQWSIYTGVLVKAKLGSGKLTDKDLAFLNIDTAAYIDDGDFYQKINYFLVPILAKYNFKNRMHVEAGVQLGLMYKVWVEFKSKSKEKTSVIKEFNKEMVNRIDAGLMAGTGYKFQGKEGRPGWTLGVKYYYGLTNVYKDKPGTKNSSIFLKLNIPIGAGDKARARQKEKAQKRAEKKAAKAKEKQK